MNVNELADKLDSISYECTLEEWRESPVGMAAAMLRQQQAEIGFYKQDADKYKLKCESQQAEIEALKKKNSELETTVLNYRAVMRGS